ncbi:MAG: glycosyltransferase family 4 protein [Betaproteobacteria bacterium]|nr:glycosyltransferase family 4 protein [Betaproteobacteria bacterium]
MLDIAALTAGRDVPSTRFRMRQHFPRLAAAGLRVTEYCPPVGKYAEWPLLGPRVAFRYKAPFTALLWAAKTATRLPGLLGSWRSDITWLSRDLVVGLPTLEPLLGKPLVLDVDDAVWCTWPFGRQAARRTARHSDLVIAGNATLAAWFSEHAPRVEVVPTAVDIHRFAPAGRRASRDGLVLGWIGSASNLPYLEAIVPALHEVMRHCPEVWLRVVADAPPQLAPLDPARVEFIHWTAAGEGDAVRGMDIGLMPLPDDEWTRGKCSLKMLQYLACGIPVAVSPVGMNGEVLAQAETGFGPRNHDEWVDALLALRNDATQRERLGRNGRLLVERLYATDVIAARLASLFLTLR